MIIAVNAAVLIFILWLLVAGRFNTDMIPNIFLVDVPCTLDNVESAGWHTLPWIPNSVDGAARREDTTLDSSRRDEREGGPPANALALSPIRPAPVYEVLLSLL